MAHQTTVHVNNTKNQTKHRTRKISERHGRKWSDEPDTNSSLLHSLSTLPNIQRVCQPAQSAAITIKFYLEWLKRDRSLVLAIMISEVSFLINGQLLSTQRISALLSCQACALFSHRGMCIAWP